MGNVMTRRYVFPCDIKKLFTLCRVARLGFASGIDVDIQVNLCRMKSLLMEGWSSAVTNFKLPLSSK
ncbi:hypothetical protein EYC84_003150 [Monilinia fructicola]|uniref:Uncharacterized protein n=1 Tax=Monilinia fructicola TaxID=38448 RepID=A0A5M9JVR1_MONFR|nr:hypothetical protein EYC84_003150 [Monilinia fructicola]